MTLNKGGGVGTLADEVLLNGMWSREGEGFETVHSRNQMIRMGVATSPIVDCTNVAEYMERESESGRVWDWRKDFPNLAPPFGAWWMEFKVPRWSEQYKHSEVTRIGAFCFVLETDKDGPFIREDARIIRPDNPMRQFAVLDSLQDKDARWVVSIAMVLKYRFKPFAPLVLHMAVRPDGSINPEGTVAATTNKALMELLSGRSREEGEEPPSIDDLAGAAWDMCYPFLLSISMMHCRNVTLEDGIHPRADRRRREKDQQREPTLPGLVKFKTINIEPMQRVLRSEGGSGERGLQHALHICRGHFKTFDEKPLFGKYRGTFWWDSIVRGSRSKGQVIHDYNVRAE